MSEFECELQDLHTIGKVDFAQYDKSVDWRIDSLWPL